MKTSVEISPKPPLQKEVAGERELHMNIAMFICSSRQSILTEDCIDLDCAKGDKSSVSCADSSFAKGAFGALAGANQLRAYF